MLKNILEKNIFSVKEYCKNGVTIERLMGYYSLLTKLLGYECPIY